MRLFVCHASDVTETPREFAVPELRGPVMAVRVGEQIVVTQGFCPHEDVSLVDGSCQGGRITCGAHGYSFDLKTGACAHDPSLRLVRYRVHVPSDGTVWISLPLP